MNNNTIQNKIYIKKIILNLKKKTKEDLIHWAEFEGQCNWRWAERALVPPSQGRGLPQHPHFGAPGSGPMEISHKAFTRSRSCIPRYVQSLDTHPENAVSQGSFTVKCKDFSPFTSVLVNPSTPGPPLILESESNGRREGEKSRFHLLPYLQDLKLWASLSHVEGKNFALNVRLKIWFRPDEFKTKNNTWKLVLIAKIRWSLNVSNQKAVESIWRQSLGRETTFRLLLLSFSKDNIPTFEKMRGTKA